MEFSRLNTEELIQNTRDHYDASKYQQRIRELELALQLRNKEVQCLTSQLASKREESSARNKQLEAQITSLKTELANVRVKQVKSNREQSDKHDQAIEELRKLYESQLAQRSQEWKRKYEDLTKAHDAELQSLKEHYQGYIRFEKQETQACKTITHEHSHNFQLIISQLQEEKKAQVAARKQSEAKAESYRDALQAATQQFQVEETAKDQTICELKGQIEGLRTKLDVLGQTLEEERNRTQQIRANRYAMEQLEQINHKLTEDNQRYRAMLRDKEDQALVQLKQSHHCTNTQPTTHQFHCSHSGLLHQMETNLQLKDRQIQELRAIVEEWTRTIGFDRPLNQRLQQLSEMSSNTKNLNQKWVSKLRGSKENKVGKKAGRLR